MYIIVLILYITSLCKVITFHRLSEQVKTTSVIFKSCPLLQRA